MTYYVPGTEEKDLSKVIRSLQQVHENTATNTTNIATSTTAIAAMREPLTASRTYYVRTDGSDSNTGLANTAAGAFLTIQAAIDYIRDNIDAGNQQIVIQVGAGTYGNVRLYPILGSYQRGSHNEAILRGDVASLGNVKISTVNDNCIDACNCWYPWRVEGFEFTATGSGSHIVLEFDSKIYIGTNKFGVSGGPQVALAYRSIAEFVDNYTISGNATYHIFANHQSQALNTGVTVTLTGTPAFSSAFCGNFNLSFVVTNGNIYSGAATGNRYFVFLNSVIDTQGAGANYFPGNAAGTAGTGGIYN